MSKNKVKTEESVIEDSDDSAQLHNITYLEEHRWELMTGWLLD